MKILSLFDGISCGRLALERVGLPVEQYDAFEIDRYAITISKKNYPDIVHHGDVFDGDFTKFKGYDLLLVGSPCTYWSIAKKGVRLPLTAWDSSCSWSMFGHSVRVSASIFFMKITTLFIKILKTRSASI